MGIRDSKYDREQTRDNNTSMKKIIWPIYGRERRGQVVNRKPLKNNDNADEWKGLIQVKNEHSGAVNSLTTIKPSYCISGGKDHQIIVQVYAMLNVPIIVKQSKATDSSSWQQKP